MRVWLPGGAARGLLLAARQDLDDLRIEECWGADQRQSWVQYTPEAAGQSDGAQTDCAGRLAAIDIADPDLTPLQPGTSPEVPE